MIAIMMLVMIVGTALDLTPTILILTPVLMPLVKAAGIDPLLKSVRNLLSVRLGILHAT